MANKQIIDDSIWSERLNMAESYYKDWEGYFKCDILDRYYEGEQWKSQREMGYDPYVVNKIYETIQIKVANFIPTFPIYTLSARTGDDFDSAMHSTQLKEDTLNTIVKDPEGNFADEIEQAYKDSFFRFGIVEVGYSADWIDNPNAPRPLLGKDTDVDLSRKMAEKIKKEPPTLPKNERIYVKHIPAKRFRIGGTDHKYLNRCGWFGYYEYVDKTEILALPKILNRDKFEGASFPKLDEPNTETLSLDVSKYDTNMVKVWKLWDMKSQNRLVVVENPVVTIFQRKFDYIPIIDFRPDKRIKTQGFYPVPPSYHWLSSQNEYNETREMLRSHRRRFVRKFQYRKGSVDDQEIEKFETGPDGALIQVNQDEAIKPVLNADLGNSLNESISTSADDLNQISGTTIEARGDTDTSTATQANIVNQRSTVRESKERDRIRFFYNRIGRLVLATVQDKFTGKIFVETSSPDSENFLGSVRANAPNYREITSGDLKDSYDFKIDVDVTSMSVVAQQSEKQKMLEFMSILNQFPMVGYSPYLIREIAFRTGYRNEKAIAEFQQMALLQELGRMNTLKAQASGQPPPGQPQGGNMGQQITAQQTPPGMQQIQNQLQNQVGLTGK